MHKFSVEVLHISRNYRLPHPQPLADLCRSVAAMNKFSVEDFHI